MSQLVKMREYRVRYIVEGGEKKTVIVLARSLKQAGKLVTKMELPGEEVIEFGDAEFHRWVARPIEDSPPQESEEDSSTNQPAQTETSNEGSEAKKKETQE